MPELTKRCFDKPITQPFTGQTLNRGRLRQTAHHIILHYQRGYITTSCARAPSKLPRYFQLIRR